MSDSKDWLQIYRDDAQRRYNRDMKIYKQNRGTAIDMHLHMERPKTQDQIVTERIVERRSRRKENATLVDNLLKNYF